MVGQSTPPPVVLSSQITGFAPTTSNPQITKIVVDTNGNIIVVDKDLGNVFMLPAHGGPAVNIGNVASGGTYSNGGMAIDAQNNLYFTNNWSGNCIKVPYSNGTWNFASKSTLAGAPPEVGWWYAGTDLTVDGSGNVYVALGNGSKSIWKFDTGGGHTLVVNNLPNDPANLAADAAGNLYFDDGASASVWRVPAGTTGVSGVGSLVTVGAGLSKPTGVTVDAAGNLYISDATAKVVVMVPNENGSMNTAHQVVLTSIIAKAPVAVDAQGSLYVSDGGGIVTKVLFGSAAVGSGLVNGTGTPGKLFLSFTAPVTLGTPVFTTGGAVSTEFAVAATSTCTAGTSYVANQTCELDIALAPQAIGTIAGKLSIRDNAGTELAIARIYGVGQGPGLAIAPASQSTFASGFLAPQQTTIDRLGNVYVADSAAGKVLKFAAGGGSGVSVGTGLSAPTGVAVDGFGNVFIADSGSVIKVPADGSAQTTVATGLSNGKNIAVDGAGNVYVADSGNGRVLKIVPANFFLPNGGIFSVGSGLSQPTGVAVDASGNLFVVDAGNNTLSEITASSQTAISNSLQSPVAVAVDASGSLYVAQPDSVTKIPNENGIYNLNSAAPAASGVVAASAVSLDAAGNLYVSDTAAPAVLLVSPNASLYLGKANIGSTSAPLNATLFNIGNQPLTLASSIYTALGPDAADFQVAASSTNGCDPATPLAPGTACELAAVFAPLSTAGARTDAVQIQSNAANSSNATLTLTGTATALEPTTVALTVAPTGTLTYPVSITLSATVAPTVSTLVPSGTLNFIVDGVAQAPVALVNGSAQMVLAKLNGGDHVFGASYSGDEEAGLAASNGQLTVTINRAASTTTIAPLAQYTQTTADPKDPKSGTDLSLSATVTSANGTPTGTVTFYEGTTALGSAQLDAKGNATFTATKLPDGDHTITAKYVGDVNYLSSQSASTSTKIMPPSMLIAASPATITVNAGSTATTTLTLTSIAGFNDQAVLSCDQASLPTYAVCAFSYYATPTNVSPTASASTVLTIMTNVSTTTTQSKSSGGGLWMTSTFALGLIGFVFGNRKKINARVVSSSCMLLLFVAMAGFSSCGGEAATKAPINTYTPPGTFMVSVQAHGKSTTGANYVSQPFQIAVTVK